MTGNELRAEAVAADREADAILAKVDAARGGSNVLRPAGFERELEQASDLRRRARALRAEAAEIALESAPSPVAVAAASTMTASSPNSVSTAGAVALPLPSTPAAEDHQETVEAVATRIINSDLPDSAAPGMRLVTSASNQSGAAEDLEAEAIVARILRA